jgi:hypothetical protein
VATLATVAAMSFVRSEKAIVVPIPASKNRGQYEPTLMKILFRQKIEERKTTGSNGKRPKRKKKYTKKM